MRSQEFTGKTTQEAIDAGLAALGVTIADVHVDVIEEGAKGLFGLFGSKPARVRLTVMEEEREDDHGLSDLLGSFSLGSETQARKKPAAKSEQKAAAKPEPKPAAKSEPKPAAKPEPKPAAKSEPKPAAKPEPKSEPKPAAKPEAKADAKLEVSAEVGAQSVPAPKTQPRPPRPPRPPKPRAPKQQKPAAQGDALVAEEERYIVPMEPAQPFTPTEPPVMHEESTPAGRAQRFLMDVTARMNVKVDVYVDDSKPDSLYIHMIGDTLGVLIGRRGETLDALQYLTSLQVNKGRDGYVRVTLDTENYRARREDSLRRLAQRMANRAQKTGRKVVLEPMNPYERRVLHTALQNHPAVTTHSEGEEPNRRVVIMLKNPPERAQQAERADEGGSKSAGARRGRGRRRGGRRGPKPEGAPVQDAPQTQESAQAEPQVQKAGAEE